MKWMCVLLTAASWCAAGVQSPPLGFTRTPGGTVVRVSGIAGAFVATPVEQSEVVSAGFSGTMGLLKLATTVRALDAAGEVAGKWDAPEGPALFGFDPSGGAALVWYGSTRVFSVLRGSEWAATPIDAGSLGGEVLGVALQDSRRALILVGREQLTLVRVRLSDGATERETVIGEGSGPAIVWPSGAVLFRAGEGFAYRSPDGTQQNLELPDGELTQMSAGWVQLRTEAGGQFAIRVGTDARIFELPEVSQ